MKKLALIAVLVLGLWGTSCVDNEISFFIEHAKAQPEAPNCVWSPSDDFATTGTLDLAFSGVYNQAFLVQNQVMSREDYDNLIAETNGIFVEGYEVSARLAPNEAIGGTESADVEIYVEPESVGIIPVTVLSSSMVDELAGQLGCPELDAINYPEENVYSDGTDESGEFVGRHVGTSLISVRFLGHTNGGLDVETPEFTFIIEMCCGCLVNWENCGDPCERYCESPEEDKMCIAGVANGSNLWDCRHLYADPQAEWTDLTNDNCVEVNEDGETVTRLCNCGDCSG